MSEMLTEAQLDTVSGGNAIDRGILISTMKEQGFGKYLESGGDNEAILKNTCKKYGIGYKVHTFSCDEFYINGTWRSSLWIKDHKNETITFIKGKLGIE